MKENEYNYNPWPLGQIPVELQRNEIALLRAKGYKFGDPREVIDMFEERVAAFAGSKYAIATDSCTHALELCFRYLLDKGELKQRDIITVPNHTYISVALLLHHLGFQVSFKDYEWSGLYNLKGSRVYDAAVKWEKDMYLKNIKSITNISFDISYPLMCTSFQIKKRIPIGRGGMILCDTKEEYDWFKLAVYDGRNLKTPYDQPGHLKMYGWHYYMTPEDAARGMLLMDQIEQQGDTGNSTMYPDIEIMLKK